MVADLRRITPLRRLLQAGLVVLVVLAAFAVYAGLQASTLTTELNQRTETIRTLNRLLSSVQDIETGQRGYVITGYDDFLQPFQQGSIDLQQLLPKLALVLSNDLARVDQLKQLAEARLKNAESSIHARRHQGFAAAQVLVMNRQGKQLMDKLRALIDPLLADLRQQIDADTQRQASAKLQLLTCVIAFVLVLFLMVPAAWYVWRQQLQKESLEQQRLQLTRELLTAQVDERKRISQLLHDDIAQVVAAAKLSIEMERQRQDEGQAPAPERLQNATDMLERALNETRSLLGELRPPLLSELGLQAALNYEIERMRHRAGHTTLGVLWQNHGDNCRFDSGTEHSIFLLVREALHNALRHANARHIGIEANCNAGQLRIAIQDDGVGFDAENSQQQEGHLGLVGMRERAASLGGSVTISSRRGKGSVVVLTLPRHAA